MNKVPSQIRFRLLNHSIKRRLTILLLSCILLLTYGSVGAAQPKTSPALALQTEDPVVVTVGFDCFAWKPEWLDPLKFDLTTTNGTAQNVADKFRQYGFDISHHNTPSKFDPIASEFGRAQVFFYAGHGFNQGLGFVDGGCNVSQLVTSSNLENVSAPNLQLAVILACSTGENTQDPQNFLVSLQRAGARKALGFNRDVNMHAAGTWSELFWGHVLDDNLEASEAARKAAGEVSQHNWLNVIVPGGIDESALAIVGNEDVYLAREAAPSNGILSWLSLIPAVVQQFIQGLWNNISNLISSVWEDLQEKIQAGLESLQRKLEQWFAETLKSLINEFLRELDRVLYQLCCAPGPVSMIFMGTLVYSARKRKS